MKNTAKTLTLTAKKAPAKTTTAQLAVPKTATSYFLETEAAAKVTVVKTRSRLASLKAQAEAVEAEAAGVAVLDAAPAIEAAAVDAAPVAEAPAPVAEVATPIAAPAAAPAVAAAPAAEQAAPVAAEAAAEPEAIDADLGYSVPTTPAVAPVIVRKRTSKLAALKAADEPAPAVAAVAVPAPAAPAAAAEAAPKVVRTRTARRIEPTAPTVIATGGSTVSKTTDAATLAAIDTTGYLLPQVKVPGRRGRKPSEFMPENDEVAALNAVERAELKAVSKARERKAKGIGMLSEAGFSETELENAASS